MPPKTLQIRNSTAEFIIYTKRATAFLQWATSVLRDYALRGYVIDRKRMENGAFLDEDYFEHLLAEIREIRLSERRFYQSITDIYSTTMDYSKNAAITKEFLPRFTRDNKRRQKN